MLAAALVSGMLIAASAWWVSRRGATGADRWFRFVLAASLHVGVLSMALSLAGAYRPVPWMVGNGVIAAAAWWWWRVARTGAALGRAAKHDAGERRGWVERVLLAGLVGVLALSLVEVVVTPLWGPDELTYHAARAGYWIGSGSVWPVDSANLRLSSMPFGSELMFGWAVMVSGEEWVGRVVFWAAMPMGAVSVVRVAGSLGASRGAALGAGLLYAATPTVLRHAGSWMKPDVWLGVWYLAAGWYAFAREEEGGGVGGAWRSGLAMGLALGTKLTALAVLPVVALAVVARWRWRRAGGFAGGVVAGGVAWGLGATLVANAGWYGHPLGPGPLRSAGQAEVSVRQVMTHAARAGLTLMELPVAPTEGLRRALEEAGNGLLRVTGLDRSLATEGEPGGLAGYRYRVRERARDYGLMGMAWVPMVAWAMWRGRGRWLAVVSLVGLGSAVVLVRWMGGEDRYWIGAYAAGMAVMGAALTARAREGASEGSRKGAAWMRRAGWCAVVVLGVYPGVSGAAERAWLAWRVPDGFAGMQSPFAEAMERIPAGSVVVLVGSYRSREWPVFGEGVVNRVVAWGRGAFDAERMERLLGAGATHVLLESDETTRVPGRPWAGGVETRGMAAWLRERMVEERLRSGGGVRLFRVAGAGDRGSGSAIRRLGFAGWREAEGLEAAQGPYAGLGMVRVGGPRVVVRFTSRAERVRVEMKWRGAGRMEVMVNGARVGAYAGGEAVVDFETVDGENEVEVEGARAVYQRLRVVRVE